MDHRKGSVFRMIWSKCFSPAAIFQVGCVLYICVAWAICQLVFSTASTATFPSDSVQIVCNGWTVNPCVEANVADYHTENMLSGCLIQITNYHNSIIVVLTLLPWNIIQLVTFLLSRINAIYIYISRKFCNTVSYMMYLKSNMFWFWLRVTIHSYNSSFCRRY